MRIYRLNYSSESGASLGFSYHGSMRAAVTARADAAQRSEGNDEPVSAKHSLIESLNVIPTKAGIIAALNRFGGHPDNG